MSQARSQLPCVIMENAGQPGASFHNNNCSLTSHSLVLFRPLTSNSAHLMSIVSLSVVDYRRRIDMRG